jgi:hypothetical protein
MRLLNNILLAGALALLCACETTKPVKDAQSPLDMPLMTPFDYSPLARSAYLDAFQDGFRSRPGDLAPTVDQSYRVAREMGWHAGRAEAARLRENK